MPTRPSSDVLPLRKTTKQALTDVKGDASYDEVLRTLLEMVPPDELQRRLEENRTAEERAQRLRKEAEERARLGAERSPDKQLLIARLARQRWQRWQEEGQVKELGPRLLAWNPGPPQTEAQPGVKLALQPRRGFPPAEGAREP